MKPKRAPKLNLFCLTKNRSLCLSLAYNERFLVNVHQLFSAARFTMHRASLHLMPKQSLFLHDLR